MNKRQYDLVVLVVLSALLGGICGAVFTNLFAGKFTFTKWTLKYEKVIDAEKFRVVDKDGKTHIELGGLPSGDWELRFYDKDDAANIGLGMSPDGNPWLFLSDRDDKRDILLSITSDGSSLNFLDGKAGKNHIVLSVSPDGAPALVLFDNNGKVIDSVP